MEFSTSTLASLLPMIILTVILAIIANILARQKGRNASAWTILALIPVVGYFSMLYFVGSSNLRHEEKLDRLLAKLESN